MGLCSFAAGARSGAVRAGPPALLVLVVAILTGSPAGARAGSLAAIEGDSPAIEVARLADDVGAAVREARNAGHIPSLAIAVAAGDRIVWTGAFGHSNVWAKTPARVETVYLIGSTFKTLSTLALLQQLEKGRFALDDPVSAYLPKSIELRGQAPDRPVTFRLRIPA